MRQLKFILWSAFILCWSTQITAQTVLDTYVADALKSNLVLQQKNVSLENAYIGLQRAKVNYIPTLSFDGIYSTAEGGRSAEIPVGDYLNPILGTVNSFLGPNAIPLIQNERINFLPKNYYDAKVRLAVPILNMDIINNNHIQAKQTTLSENEVAQFSRELVKEVKTTYYNYLSVQKAIEIHQNAIELAEASKKANERLVENGKGIPAYILRSESELEQARAKKKNSELKAISIQHYFNALLNREPNSAIIVEIISEENALPQLTTATVENREELHSLQQVIAIKEDVVKMNQHVYVPKLNGFLDLGSQAEQMKFNKQSLYYMAGLQLTFPIFDGLKSHYDIKKAKNEVEIAKLQVQDVEQKLQVAVKAAQNDATASYTNYETAKKQLELAETYYRLIDKGYEAGVNTFIETIDARTQLTMARLASTVSYYNYLSMLAKFERETASYPIPTSKK